MASRNKIMKMPTPCHSRGASPLHPQSLDGTSSTSTPVCRSTSVLAMADILTYGLSADLSVAAQRLLAFGGVVDDRLGVIVGAELRHPPADVSPRGIELLALRGRVEHAKV